MVRSSITGLLGGLLLSSAVGAENITSDAHFHGESPPVYPSRMNYFPYVLVIVTDKKYSGGHGNRTLGYCLRKGPRFCSELDGGREG